MYISNKQKDIVSFLEYIQRKIQENKKECSLDGKYNILKAENYDVIGKNIYGNRLGVGYGHCLYYCFSSDFDKDECNGLENERLKEILMHTGEGAKEVSELEVLYMLGLEK